MSDNHEVEQGNQTSSDPESMDELFLSPDDANGEEVEFVADDGPKPSSEPVAVAAEPSKPHVAHAAPEPEPVIIDDGALREMEAERDDYRNRMMRVAADLENFRKRAAREKEDLRKYGIDRVVLELLPVIDNLERALDHADKSEDSTTIVDGIRMVHRQFITALEKHGVKGFDAKGEQFDPQKHEAIQQVETTEHPTGYVLEEYQKGYYLHERLIRPALVVVARNPEGATVAEAAEAAVEASQDAEMSTEAGSAAAADNGVASEGSEVRIEIESEPSDDSDSSDGSAVN